MAYVFEYDTSNSRPARQNDLIAVYYPNQTQSHLNTTTRVVDVAGVYSSALPRAQYTYYQDPTDTFHYGKVSQSTVGNPAGGVGGTWSFLYLTSGLPSNLINPADPIVQRTVVTDPNGNQVTYDYNAAQIVVREERFATRSKNSLEASSWVTWTAYNSHNQPTQKVMPEGNSIQYQYEDETNTIVIGGQPYAPRIGLLKSITRLPGNSIGIPSRSGSGPFGAVQTQLIQRYFYDPLFNQQIASIEERGNPIATTLYFPPQNGGTTPTDSDRSRYATIRSLDYQKDTATVVEADTTLQTQLGLSASDIGSLISYVNAQMTATDGTGGLPAGFAMGIGDVNGEGTGSGTANSARHQGCVVQVTPPPVRQLVPNTGSGDPWLWQTQNRPELYTSNAIGQVTTYTNAEGNLTVYVRYPQNNPDGDNDAHNPALSNQQYGRIKETHVDADPSTVMTLVGSEGDMITFIGNLITRTNTPGTYLNLTSTHQGATGCTSCNYDPMGNVLTSVDARGNTTNYLRNEMGQVYRVTSPAPYNYQTETSYDANGNVIQLDTQDVVVLYTSTDPASPNYAKFTPSGSGTTANLPTTNGSGGSVRSGWFSNIYSFDLLDNKTEDDLDATGSTPSSLVTTFAYDPNNNLTTITKPQGNLVQYDYDERNLRIATRTGYVSSSQPGSTTIMAYDGNKNLLDVVGPMQRGTSSQALTAIISDAFRTGTSVTYTGDWVTQNTYDGFDRQIQSEDAVGGLKLNTFDPNGRSIFTQAQGTPGGATPADRAGSANVILSTSDSYYDEAGRAYDSQQIVFLNTGGTLSSPTHALPSSRTVTFTGGGLAVNATANTNTGTHTLTTGGISYVLGRTVFDRLGRTAIGAADNTAQTAFTFDGANRQLTSTDPLGNVSTSNYDANGNVTTVTRSEKCTISTSIAAESFGSIMLYDVQNRMIIRGDQGADGATPIWNPSSPNSALLNLTGLDSRSNRTNTIDPKANTVIYTFDGAGRQIKSQQHLRTGGIGTAAIASTVTTQSKYDGNSRLTMLIDSNSGSTTWTYDTLDRQLTMVFYDGSTRTSGYDAASDMTSYTDENGSVFANTFDVLGRKVSSSITLATNVIGTTGQSFQYDGLSRMTFARDSVGSANADSVFIFDSLGRMIEEGQSYGS
jgi:YD repeat-containing protein